MKTIVLFSINILLVAVLYAQPSAGIVIPGPDEACEGNNRTFNACASTDSFYVDYGDGIVDTFYFNPCLLIHVYSIADTFDVVLTAFSNAFPSVTDTATLIVYPSPISNYSMDFDSVCLGASINFIDLTSCPCTVSQWEWNFGDGTELDSNTNVTHQYSLPGVYYPILKTWNGKCFNSYLDTVIIKEDTTLADFIETANCPCNVIDFNNTSVGGAVQYEWDFGDGDTSTSYSSNHIFKQPDKFLVGLKGTDINGCHFTKKKTITVCGAEITLPVSKSNDTWFYGFNKGLKFNGFGPPVAVGGGQTSSMEGTCTISDPVTGDMLFYIGQHGPSQTARLYNKNHLTLLNGDCCMGAGWSSQDIGLIVPVPGNINQYYLFGVVGQTSHTFPLDTFPNGIYYSIIDMTLDGGLGGIIPGDKAKLLTLTGGSETIAGIEKTRATCTNNAEYWITVLTGAKEFTSFLIDENGISDTVISKVGNLPTNAIAQCAFSPNKKMFAMGNVSKGIELYDFNNNTGKLYNPKNIVPTLTSVIHLNFSPDNSKLYVNGSKMVQLDLEEQDIVASEVLLDPGTKRGQIYMGPDEKLYVGNIYAGSTSVINNPNTKGLGCNYVLNVINPGLGAELNNIINLNLPALPTKLNASFGTSPSTCPSFDVTFMDTSCGFKLYEVNAFWDFGDGDTISYNTLTFPTHTYLIADTFDVTLIVSQDCYLADTFVASVIVNDLPSINIVADSVCLGDTTTFQATINGTLISPLSYNWGSPINDTLSNPKAVLSSTGSMQIYLTILDSAGCPFADSSQIIVYDLPQANNSADTICVGNSVNLIGGTGISYQWLPATYLNNNTIQDPLSAPTSSIIYQEIDSSLYCGRDTGIHSIHVNSLPIISTINDTAIDLGDDITLFTTGGQTYIWTPSTYLDNSNISDPISNSLTSITYFVTGTDSNGCSASDTVDIEVIINDEFYVPNAFTPNGDGSNDLLLVEGLQGDKIFLLKIYDRWGNKVFESEDKNEGWDARTYSEGVYVYLLRITLLNDQTLEQKGNVTLVK